MSSEGEKILEQLFATPEEEVKTFMDVIKESIAEHDDNVSGKGLEEIVNGKVSKIDPADLLTQQSGYVQISHGWHGDDYVWHIAPKSERRPWKASTERVCYAVAHTMNTVIPQEVEVKFWLPYAEWDIKEVTFKAIEIKKCWNVEESSIRHMTIKLFEVLNAMF